MRALLPTLKERKRYILFRVISDLKFEKEDISKCVTQACLQFLGEYGVAQAGIQFLPETWNMESQTGVIRAGHKFVDHVKASLALVRDINGKKANLSSIKVSGVINKVK